MWSGNSSQLKGPVLHFSCISGGFWDDSNLWLSLCPVLLKEENWKPDNKKNVQFSLKALGPQCCWAVPAIQNTVAFHSCMSQERCFTHKNLNNWRICLKFTWWHDLLSTVALCLLVQWSSAVFERTTYVLHEKYMPLAAVLIFFWNRCSLKTYLPFQRWNYGKGYFYALFPHILKNTNISVLWCKVTPDKKALSCQDALSTDLLKNPQKNNLKLGKITCFWKAYLTVSLEIFFLRFPL